MRTTTTTTTTKGSRGAVLKCQEVERSLSRLNRPSRRVAGPGKRHSARGTPRAQPRDVRSAGRDTWNLTGEALGGPRERSWRRCSRARSGRRSAIRTSGALTQVPSTAPNPQIPPRAPRYARAPLTLRPTPAAALVQPGRACAEPADRPVLARAGGFAGVGSCRHRHQGGRRHLPLRHQLSARGRSVRPPPQTSLPCPPARGVAP